MPKTSLADLRNALAIDEHCDHAPFERPSSSPAEAAEWAELIQKCPPHLAREHRRWLCRNDLFWLLVYELNRRHFIVDERKQSWTFARCKEVQADPDNHLDLWSREHYKSEIITFGKTIQDILIDPEVTFGIFSHNRPMAKDFLVLIKREFESNEQLKADFSDILWQEPKLESRAASVSWSENEGITVKRKGNPKEATIEAWGLVDGQPTGKRFKRLIYDDVVSRDNISSQMIDQTTDQFYNSLLLTASDPPIFRYIATFQEIGDTTQALIDKHVGNLRLRGPMGPDGKPACVSDEKFAWFKQNLSPKVFALQLLLDPRQSKQEHEVGFNQDWIAYYDEQPPRAGMNVYILVDPAGNKLDSNSQYAMWIVGLCADKNVRILDAFLDKYDLDERWNLLFEQYQKWEPLRVGYEQYAMQADIEHFRLEMKRINYDFNEKIRPLAGGQSKDGRINNLIPWFKAGRFLFPKKGLKKKLKDGNEIDLVGRFIERELTLWPYTKAKDQLDALARLLDPALNIVWPKKYGSQTAGAVTGGGMGSWMSD